jgi:hypothetical protein
VEQTRLWRAGALLCMILAARTQAAESIDLSAVGKDPRWKIDGRTISMAEVKGKRALKFSEGPGVGLAWLEGYDFGDGAIEVDLLGRSQPVQGSFLGIALRVVDAKTHDAVYFRPFNFRATDPARHNHAVQYVSHPKCPWQVLRSQHPEQYEKAIVPEPDGDEWFHARVVVERPNVTVFVNGATAPSLAVKELSDRTRGSVGLWVGDGSGGHFANLRVVPAR